MDLGAGVVGELDVVAPVAGSDGPGWPAADPGDRDGLFQATGGGGGVTALFYPPGKPARFMYYWMSRSMYIVSPREVQRQVISQWRAWFKKHGTTFRPNPTPEINRLW